MRIIRVIKKIVKKRLNNDQNYSGERVIAAKNVYIAPDCNFEEGVKIYNRVSLNNVSVGKYTYFAPNSSINNAVIGRYCSIGPDVKIGLGLHPSKKFVSTHPAFYSVRNQFAITYADKNYFKEFLPIYIGHDVWIGANAIIRDGVKIGNGAIVGAGAVVVKDVEPYSIVGGIPAKLIRYRFTEKEIDFLEKIKWWNKSNDWIRKNWNKFMDIQKFLEENKSIIG